MNIEILGEIISIKGDGFELEFNKSELGKSIKYDRVGDYLVVSDLPDELIKKIAAAIRENEDDETTTS